VALSDEGKISVRSTEIFPNCVFGPPHSLNDQHYDYASIRPKKEEGATGNCTGKGLLDVISSWITGWRLSNMYKAFDNLHMLCGYEDGCILNMILPLSSTKLFELN
jgi:hypothetical protein